MKTQAYRVYFNRLKDDPQVWCVDEGDIRSEINVQYIYFLGVSVRTVTSFATPVGDSKEPRAWFQVHGVMTIENGAAVFRPVGQAERLGTAT